MLVREGGGTLIIERLLLGDHPHQHVHESAVRMAFKLLPGRVCLISDALLRHAGRTVRAGGQDVFLKDGIARLRDGTIAGSAATLTQCLQNAVAFGID